MQPLDLIGDTVRSLTLAAEIIAAGGDADTMFKQFEDAGEVTPRADTLYVDCSSYGLPTRDPLPIFAPDRITLQYVRHLSPSFSAALIGWVEAHRTDTAEKNRLCPPHPTPSHPEDWAPMLVRTWLNSALWRAEPELAAWIDNSRLNLGVSPRMRDDPVVRESVERLRRRVGPAVTRHLARPPERPGTVTTRG